MQSMTGFARIDGADDGAQWVIEAKSVNAKGLDVRVRAPQGYDAVDAALRKAVKQRLGRGTIQVSVSYTKITAADAVVHVNQDVIDAYLAAYDGLKGKVDAPRFDGLMRLPGVLRAADDDEDQAMLDTRLAAMAEGADKLIIALQQARAEEGAALKTILQEQLDTISGLVGKARGLVSSTQDILEARLTRGLDALGARAADFDEARLAQEVALMIVKADVTEELDRLDGHIAAAQELLSARVPVGRKFDFLMQEFNREANTLCSKAVDQSLTTIGLDLKTLIDQMKEQIQNVE